MSAATCPRPVFGYPLPGGGFLDFGDADDTERVSAFDFDDDTDPQLCACGRAEVACICGDERDDPNAEDDDR